MVVDEVVGGPLVAAEHLGVAEPLGVEEVMTAAPLDLNLLLGAGVLLDVCLSLGVAPSLDLGLPLAAVLLLYVCLLLDAAPGFGLGLLPGVALRLVVVMILDMAIPVDEVVLLGLNVSLESLNVTCHVHLLGFFLAGVYVIVGFPF